MKEKVAKRFSFTPLTGHNEVAEVTAHIFEVLECGSHGRLFGQASVWEEEGSLPGRAGLGILYFVFKPGDDQNVNSGLNQSFTRIPGLDRSHNAVKNSYQVLKAACSGS